MKNQMNKIYTNIYIQVQYIQIKIYCSIKSSSAQGKNDDLCLSVLEIVLPKLAYEIVNKNLSRHILINLIKVRVSLYFPPILLRFLCFSFAISGTYAMSVIRELKNVSFSIYT